MIFKLEKPKPRNGRFCPALLNVWVYNSEFAKGIDTELISKQCYREYAHMKATKLKVVNAIDKLNYNRRQLILLYVQKAEVCFQHLLLAFVYLGGSACCVIHTAGD